MVHSIFFGGWGTRDQVDKRLQWRHQSYSDILKHNQPHSGTSQQCSDIFRTLCNWAPYEINTITPSWTQDVNWTYKKHSEDVQFTSCVQEDRSTLNVKKYGGRETWILIYLEILLKNNCRIILWNTFLAPGLIS